MSFLLFHYLEVKINSNKIKMYFVNSFFSEKILRFNDKFLSFLSVWLFHFLKIKLYPW